jgi:hypothetical protein
MLKIEKVFGEESNFFIFERSIQKRLTAFLRFPLLLGRLIAEEILMF